MSKGDVRLKDQTARDLIRERLDLNLLVEAGAGSGKTHSLADRMTAGIASGRYTVEHMAAVTFTRKAAAELRGRFQLALEKRLENERDTTARARIMGALAGLERLFAGTIHSFCAHLLRERPVEANLAPGFTEVDEVEDLELRQRGWLAFIAEADARESEDLAGLRSAGIRPDDLEKAFKTVCTFDEVAFPGGDAPDPDLRAAWAAFDGFWKNLEACVPKPFPAKFTCPVLGRVRRCRAKMRVADRSRSGDLVDILGIWQSKPDFTQKNWHPDPKEKKRITEEVAALIVAFQAATIAPFLEAWRRYNYDRVVGLLAEGREFVRARRAAALTLNYTDLLQKAAALLRENRGVRRELQDKYRWLFVDEFQDTDPIQAEAILLLASEPDGPDFPLAVPPDTLRLRPGALFIVGDPKQSIFRFRRADIRVYNHVREIVEKTGGQVASLITSFRALPDLCDWNNAVFEKIFPSGATPEAPSFQRLEPDPETPKKRDVSRLDTGVRVLSVPAGIDEEQVAAADAAAIARYVRSEINAKHRTAADFLVLTWKKEHLKVYAAALEAQRIPLDVTGAGAFKESREVAALVGLLRLLADPDDGSKLVGVLRGRLFGISDEELYAHAKAGGHFGIRHAARSDVGRSAGLPRPERSRRQTRDSRDDVAGYPPVQAALEALAGMHRLTRELLLPAALELILESTGLLALAAAQSIGAEDAADLLQAVDYVRQAAEEGATLTDAAEALAVALDTPDVESLPLEPGRRDVVRVMNLHKAKGLEAPVVFLADPLGGFPARVDVRIVREAGQVAGYFQVALKGRGKWSRARLVAQPAGWDAHEQAELPYLEAEANRLRYVAATRPRDLLVISRYEGDGKDIRPWAPFESFLGTAPELAVAQEAPSAASSKPDLSAMTRARLAAERDARFERGKIPTFTVDSVTARTHRELIVTEEDPERIVRGPATGIEWGDLIHALLEYAMSHPASTRADLERCARWLTVEKAEMRGVVPEALDLVQRVMASDTWARAQSAEECHVEVPFAIAQPGPDGRPMILSGVIDLAFRDADGWKIVDYKSDQIASPDGRELVEKYAPQLDAYAAALKQITPSARVITGLHAVRAGVTHWQTPQG